MRLAAAAAVLLVTGGVLYPGRAEAGDPSLRWRTLETEHFRIHFYQGEQAAARALAVRAERAHRLLAPLLGHAPAVPTQVVLTDDVDSANGSATVLPYNLVRLFLTAPESESVLNDYDDWLNLLITHEYSHILHIDNISGLATLANLVVGLGMGKIYAPNQIQPRWFIEGLATYEESARTTGGRTRSHIFEMYLRTAIFDEAFQGLDAVSSGTLEYPHGSTAYLYGSFFLKYIADRFGEQVLAEISRSYGGRSVPFGLNRAVAEATGHDYEELWRDFKEHLRHRFEVQRREIEARGRTIERRLTSHGESTIDPHPFDGKDGILYVRNDGYRRPALMLVPAGGGPPRQLLQMEVGGEATPLGDGRHVVTSEGEVCRTVYYYNDLFVVDLQTGRRRRLTTCARASSPDASPDRRQIVFAQNGAGGEGASLAVVDVDGESPPRVLVRGNSRTHIYTPVWSPDGRTIAYSEWSEGGYRDIVLYDVASGQTRRLLHDRAFDITPRFSPDGRYLLFSSDRTGVYNVFAWELGNGRLWQVTNVLAGAFEPVVAADGHTLVYQGFTPRGYDLFSADFEPARWQEALPFVSDREDPALDQLARPADEVVIRERPYSAWETAHPWRVANLSTQPGGFEQQVALDLTGADATGIHSWNLHLEQGLGGRGETNEVLSYTWDRLWAPLSLGGSHRTVRAGGLVIDGQARAYAEEQWSAQALATLPIVRHLDHSVTVNLNYHYSHFGPADRLDVPLDPNQAIPVIPERGALAGVGAGFVFSNVRRYAFSVSGEEGRTIALNLNLNDPALGGDFRTVDVSWSWTEFLQLPLRRHVLELAYSGGAGQGDLARRGLFFLGGFGDNAAADAFLLCALKVKADRCPFGTPPLRGYVPGAFYGDQFHVLTTEWRFPITEVEKGPSTLPVYLNRLVGAVYADYGLAYSGDTHLDNFKLGVGAELGLNLTLGYSEGASLRLGYARGLMQEGQDQVYVQFQLGQLY
jgi:hypothetical protein